MTTAAPPPVPEPLDALEHEHDENLAITTAAIAQMSIDCALLESRPARPLRRFPLHASPSCPADP